MSNRYAIVVDNIVVNMVLASEPLGENWILSDTAGIGDIYNPEDGTFSRPPRPMYVQLIIAEAFVEGVHFPGPLEQITATENSQIRFSLEMREYDDAQGPIHPLNGVYRVMLDSQSAPRRLFLARFVDGCAQAALTFRESGIWYMTLDDLASGPSASYPYPCSTAIYITLPNSL